MFETPLTLDLNNKNHKQILKTKLALIIIIPSSHAELSVLEEMI